MVVAGIPSVVATRDQAVSIEQPAVVSGRMGVYAGVVTLEGSAEQLEQLGSHFRERVLPSLRAQAGFQGAYLLRDREGGKGFGISLWESEQAARAARDGMAERRREGAQVLGRDAPLDFQIFEVVERA